MENTKTKETIFINFLDDEYFKVKLLSLKSNENKINKKNNTLKNLMNYWKNQKININFYFDEFLQNDIIDFVLENENMLVFYSSKNTTFIIYNLTNDNILYIDITTCWWCETLQDVKVVLKINFDENNINYNDKVLDDIIENINN